MEETVERENWVELDAERLVPGELATFKQDGKQLVVGRTHDGCAFALDNRCPHEGYPLASGTLKDEALTCCWHNWKFDVRDGACTLGGEDVRRYPTREVDGRVEVDLSDPDPALEIPRLVRSLHDGMFEHANGRALRDAVRLLKAGLEPVRLLAEIAAFDAERAEYGTTHALPVAADAGRFLARHPGVQAAIALAPAIDMAGEANRRLPVRPQPAPLPGATGARVRAAVEAEDVERAEALFLGALASGTPRAELERWLYAVVSDHFLGFGHSLIYLVKAQELLDRAGDDFAPRILPALLFESALSTREDTLPYFEPYTRRLAAVEDQLADLWARRPGRGGGPPVDRAGIRAALVDGSVEQAFDALWEALGNGADPHAIAEAVVLAGAHRLWRFDLAVDVDPEVLETWVWATHRFTFASAVRNALLRFDSPDALRFLFQALGFVHSGRRMDRAERELPAAVDSDLAGVLAAVGDRDAERAVARLLGYLSSDGSVDALREAVEDVCLADPLVRPIGVAHAIKTAVAAFEEYAALAGVAGREVVLAALVRFLASPVLERRVQHEALRSIRWVADGVMPRKLTQ